MPRILLPIVLMILLCPAMGIPALAQSFPPPGDLSDPSLAAFVADLKTRVANEDRAYILSIVHEQCEVGFGGFRGRADFEEYWFGPAAHGRGFFTRLAHALELGGTWVGNSSDVIFPYTALAPPMDTSNILLAVVTSPSINVRAWPGLKGRVVGQAGNELVRLCNIEVPIAVDGMEWSCILLPDDQRGYVASSYLERPTSHPFVFRKENDGWMLIRTVAY